MKKKYKLKRNIKRNLIILFSVIVIGIVIYIGIQSLMSNRKQEKIEPLQPSTDTHKVENTDKNEEENENLQVAVIGNSDAYSGWNPLQLWHEKGITSFVGAGAKQNTKLSYYILQEILSVSKPQILILEANAFFDEREHLEPQGYEYTATKYCSKLFENTTKWNDIKDENYMNENFNKERMKLYGYYYNNDMISYSGGYSYMKKTQEKESFSSFTKKYLPKIMNLCKENNIKVMLIAYPSATSWTYKKYNAVNDYAQENDIPFIDFNIETNLTDFNWLTDSRDGGNHLNHSGATKMMSFFGDYLIEKYQIKNYKNNKNYQHWNEDYNEFIKKYVDKE
ncbi:MAG: hypothetical protein ACLUVC_02485 [Longibaculum sp.]